MSAVRGGWKYNIHLLQYTHALMVSGPATASVWGCSHHEDVWQGKGQCQPSGLPPEQKVLWEVTRQPSWTFNRFWLERTSGVFTAASGCFVLVPLVMACCLQHAKLLAAYWWFSQAENTTSITFIYSKNSDTWHFDRICESRKFNTNWSVIGDGEDKIFPFGLRIWKKNDIGNKKRAQNSGSRSYTK